MRLASFAQITALAVPLLAGGLWAQGQPGFELAPELRAACDTMVAVFHGLRAADVERSDRRVRSPLTGTDQPGCRIEARVAARVLPEPQLPEKVLALALNWPQDPRYVSIAIAHGNVVCFADSRRLPDDWYRMAVRCVPDGPQAPAGAAMARSESTRVAPGLTRVLTRPALPTDAPPLPSAPRPPRPVSDTARTPGAPAMGAAPPESVTKRRAPPPDLPSKERVLGPFAWRDREVRCVLTDVWLGRDTTVSALRLVDAHNTVLYQESFGVAAGATGLEEQVGVVPVLLEASDGVTFMLKKYSEPSAPMGGVSLELLAWKDGQIRPLSPALTVYGEFLDLPKGDKPNTVRLLPGNLMPIRVWAYSFAVRVSLEIRLTAFAAGDPEPLRPRVQIDTLSGLAIFPVSDVVPGDREETKQVMLYRSASGSAGEPVQVRRTSQIQYGPAYGRVRLDRDPQGRFVSIETGVVRLRVTIDGKTGFVEASDFSTVGLGSAG